MKGDTPNETVAFARYSYKRHRYEGSGREEAVAATLADYAQEPLPNRFAAWVGLALSLADKRELYAEFTQQLQEQMQQAQQQNYEACVTRTYRGKLQRVLQDDSYFGKAAAITPPAVFDPGWQKGDLLVHRIIDVQSASLAVHADMSNHSILMMVVGKATGRKGEHYHLVITALCPSDRLPATAEEVEQLPWVILEQFRGQPPRYVGRLQIKSKQSLAEHGLTRIGRFPELLEGVPDYTAEMAERTKLLSARAGRYPFNGVPFYEDEICIRHYLYTQVLTPEMLAEGEV